MRITSTSLSKFLLWALPLFAVEVTVSILYRADHPWVMPVIVIATVTMSGVIGASSRSGPNRRPAAQIAEVSTVALSALQEVATSHGFRNIDSTPIGPHLSPDCTHFLIQQPKRKQKRDISPTVRCIALFYLSDGTPRISEIELDHETFEDLIHVNDSDRAAEIVKQGTRARVYVGPESKD
jgi:hypothetical protein